MFRNKGLSALALIIILAVLGFGGYAVWQKQATTPPPALPQGEGMENWKTYQDKYGLFEFKHPVNYTVIDNEPNSDTIKVFASDTLVFSVLFTAGGEFGNDYHFIFSGNSQVFKQILSTFKFTK